MAKSNEEQKKTFIVIQFKNVPFESINTYVCVPDSWLIAWYSDATALVAHPVEDPSVTKARVKRRQEFRNDWKCYSAYIKYESDSYSDAQLWIATKKKEEDRDLKCETFEPSCNYSQNPNKKKSIKRPMQPDLKIEHSEKRPKIDETAATSNRKKITSKTIQYSHVTEEKPFVQPAHLNTLQSTKSTRLEKKKSPIYQDRNNGADNPTEGMINNMSAGQIQQPNVQQYGPNQENDLMQTPQVRNSIKTSTQDQSIDQSGFHGAFMKEKRAFQSKPNSENQPSSLARNENQCKQANSPKDAYKESISTNNRNYTSRDPRLLKKLNANAYTEQNTNVRAAHPKSIMVEQTPAMQSVEVQSTSSSNRSQETKYNKVYQTPQVRNIIKTSPIYQDRKNGADMPSLENPTDAIINNMSAGQIQQPNVQQYVPNQENDLMQTPQVRNSIKTSPIYQDRKNGADMPSLENPTEGIINNMSAGQIQQPNVQQCVPNQENDLMKTPQVRNSIKTSTQDQSIDQSGLHGAFMGEKRAFQSKPNSENQPSSLVRNENQCKQANSPKDAYKESILTNNRNYTSRDPRILKKLNANAYTEQNDNVRAAHPKSIMVEQTPAMQSVEVQPTSSLNRSQETKYNKVYQTPQVRNIIKTSPIYQDRKNGADMPSLENPTEGIINNMSAGQIQQPNVQQYGPNQENDLMQTPQVRNSIKTSTQDQSIDQSGFHGAFMREKRAFQSKPNSENQPSSLARNENQCKQANSPKDTHKESFLTNNRNYTSRDPRLLKNLNANAYTEQNTYVRAAHPKSVMVELTPAMQRVQVQPTSSSNRSQETKYNKVYQNPQTLKMGVDQPTETIAATKEVHFWANTLRKPPIESFSIVTNRMCQTDDYFSGESLSPNQAFISGNIAVTNNKVIPDYEMSLKGSPCEMINEADSPTASIPLKDDPSVGPIAGQPTTSSNPVISRNVIEQQMLDQMSTTLFQTCKMFKSLHSSILEPINIYYTLREAVHAINTLGNSLNSLSSYVVSKTSHISEKKQTEEGNPNNNYYYNNVDKSVNKAPKPNQGHNRTFVLPPEYDPNDSKWTLKYRRSKPKCTELMPQSDIYVKVSRFERCKRGARDCNTLAQMLLTEVFSISALCVCSLTGREAEASRDKDNVRPGLDEWARMVLLKFVQKFGLQRGWNTADTEGILQSMRDKIYEIRARCG